MVLFLKGQILVTQTQKAISCTPEKLYYIGELYLLITTQAKGLRLSGSISGIILSGSQEIDEYLMLNKNKSGLILLGGQLDPAPI